jgi:8-oxo-dGTP pyrophosphatase MutT (NUDIX family)
MIEPSDQTALAAAMREAAEEVGLVGVDPLGAVALPSVGTLSSDIVIQPFWVRLPQPPRLQAAPDEVDEILLVPLNALHGPGILQTIPHPRRPSEWTPAFVWEGHVIWGATLRTLRDLLDLLTSGLD